MVRILTHTILAVYTHEMSQFGFNALTIASIVLQPCLKIIGLNVLPSSSLFAVGAGAGDPAQPFALLAQTLHLVFY